MAKSAKALIKINISRTQGLCWFTEQVKIAYDGIYDVNQNGQVNFQDAGLTWINRD